MKAIIYTRYSPQRNSKESESCEVQAAYCEEYAAKKKWEVGGIYEDRERSGKDKDRPGMWAAIDRLEKGDVLLVMKLDRLARNVYLMECIKKAVRTCKARIVAVQGDIEGDTAETELVRVVLSAVAAYERQIIAIRTKLAMKQLQKNGRAMGSRAPYGYRIKDGTLVEVKKEQGAIRYIRRLRDSEYEILEIVRAMNGSEFRTRTGRPWVRRDVDRILSNLK
jgi:site-specific DNA recombinase